MADANPVDDDQIRGTRSIILYIFLSLWGMLIKVCLEKGPGSVTSSLLQRGAIKAGGSFVAGKASGKVRAHRV